MNVTIVGTGRMAYALSTRMMMGGHHVTLVGHSPGKAEELVTELKNTINGSGKIAVAKKNKLPGEVIIMAIPYDAEKEYIEHHYEELVGKILVEISNPINFDSMKLAVNDCSGAEEIAMHVSLTTRVVKAFNTTFAAPLTEGQIDGTPLDVFIAGDDAQAKLIVAQLVESSGMHPVDTGPLARSRELEGMALLHIGMQSVNNTNFKSAFMVIA